MDLQRTPEPRTLMLAFLRRLTTREHFWSVATLVLLLLYNLIHDPHFFAISVKDGHLYGSIIDILNRGAPLMIIAMGLTLVIATHGIDISVGSTVAISGAVAAAMIGGQLVLSGSGMEDVTQSPLTVVILCAIGVTLLFGLWNGVLVAWVGLQPIVTTLILLVAGRGVAQLITNGQIVTIYYSPFYVIGNGFLLGIPFPLYIVAAVAATMALLTRKTALGLFIEAIGINPVASRLAGIRERGITAAVYTVCGVCAAIAGLIVSSNVKSADGNNAGLWFELDAILAVVLGGTSLSGGRFSLLGSILGALVLQTITTTIYAVGVAPQVTLVVKGAIVLAVSILQSDRVKSLFAATQVTQRPARVEVRTTARYHKFLPLAVTVVLFVLTYGAGSYLFEGFFSLQVFLNFFIDNAFLAITAIGMTFVILSGGIDLSVGSVIALTTMVSAALVEQRGFSPGVVIPLVLVMGCAIGFVQGVIIHYFRIQPFIVTLAFMFIARGLCYLISIDSITIENSFYADVAAFRIPLPFDTSITVNVVLALVVLAFAIYVAHFTRFGRTIYAIGGNEQSALLMGLPVARTKVLVYTFNGFCSAMAGVVFTFYMQSGYALHAQGMELDAIAAVVIGGTLLTGGSGYVVGTLFGVLMYGTIQTILSFHGDLSSWWTKIVIGALVLTFCVLQRVFTRPKRA